MAVCVPLYALIGGLPYPLVTSVSAGDLNGPHTFIAGTLPAEPRKPFSSVLFL